MALGRLQTSVGRVFTQRCFYLFVSLIVLIAVAPFFGDTVRGRFILNGAQVTYVFSPKVMTNDKLFGAAAGYLMLGVAWAYAYNLAQYLDPRAFTARPGDAPRLFFDLLYMSFGCLTSNGPGDVVPAGSKVRALVMLEQVVGTLFVAILIARLAGIYPPKHETERQ